MSKLDTNFNEQSPKAASFRAEQAMVDADIEGLARDPKLEALIENWKADGLTPDEIRAHMNSYFAEEDPVFLAAE